MDKQRQDDQLESINNSSVPIQDVALKTSREQWTIERASESSEGSESGRSLLAGRHDDDDIYILYIYIYIYNSLCICIYFIFIYLFYLYIYMNIIYIYVYIYIYIYIYIY